MLVEKKDLRTLYHTYPEKDELGKPKNIKTVGYYNKYKKIIPEFENQPIVDFTFKNDVKDEDEKVIHKKGDKVEEIYIVVKNSTDKFSIYDQKVKEILIPGHGYVCETTIYPEAFKKYLNFKNKGCKTESEIEKEKLRQSNQQKEQELEELKKKLLEAKEKEKELVIANSDLSKEIGKKDDATDNISKHRKNSKK